MERFEAYAREVNEPYRGITTSGAAAPDLFRIEGSGVSTEPLRSTAEAFLSSLNADQRADVSFPIDAIEWRRWHGLFTLTWRHGLLLQDLLDEQRAAAMRLVQASFSPRGYGVVEDIRRTNELVRELTGLYVDFGINVYWLSIFGTPSADQPWGWQLDGHHLNLHCFVLGDQVVMTPMFVGAEPTTVRHGAFAGIHLFQPEQDHALELMRALTPAQRRQSIVGDALQIELFTGHFRDNLELGFAGAPVREFSDSQRERTLALLRDWIGYMRAGHAEVRWSEVLRHLEETHFGWIGGVEDDEPFYYRLHSPVILIEFSHIPGIAMTGDAPSRNHVHAVVRTPNGNDYGKDLLRQHMVQAHAHPGPASERLL